MRGFRDRRDAGQQLGARLRHLRDEHPVVVGLPRGGVPVAFEVARALDAPLDVIVVRKLGVPVQPELGMGAVGEDGVRVLNDDVVRQARVSSSAIAAVEARERREVERRAQLYRRGRPMVPLAGRTVIVVDDGIATGGTARAALEVAARAWCASRGPRGPRGAPGERGGAGDRRRRSRRARDPDAVLRRGGVVHAVLPDPRRRGRQCCSKPTASGVVGADDDPSRRRPEPRARDDEIEIDAGGVRLAGHLTVPDRATGVVVFAHGSGSSRHSPRNRLVAELLNASGLATLLFDLLTPAEAVDRANVFDIELLAAAAPPRHPLGAPGAGAHRSRHRLLRCQHRCRRSPVRRGRRAERPGRRLAGRSPRPRRAAPRRSARAHVAHRRESRRAGARAQPPGGRSAVVPAHPRDRSGRDPPVRGARHPRSRGAPRPRLVRPPPRAGAERPRTRRPEGGGALREHRGRSTRRRYAGARRSRRSRRPEMVLVSMRTTKSRPSITQGSSPSSATRASVPASRISST